MRAGTQTMEQDFSVQWGLPIWGTPAFHGDRGNGGHEAPPGPGAGRRALGGCPWGGSCQPSAGGGPLLIPASPAPPCQRSLPRLSSSRGLRFPSFVQSPACRAAGRSHVLQIDERAAWRR